MIAIFVVAQLNFLTFREPFLFSEGRVPVKVHDDHTTRGAGQHYRPYHNHNVDWPEGKAMEWEHPGKCDLRPSHVSDDCCFGGIAEYRFACAKHSKDTVYQVEQEFQSLLLASEAASTEVSSSSRCPICDIAEYLIRYNLTLTLEGDSVMSQTFVGMRCGFQRHGYRMSEMEKYTHRRNESLSYKYGMDYIFVSRFVRIQHNDNNSAENSTSKSEFSGQILYTKAYRALDADEHAYVWKNSDIVVFDHGLHWDVTRLATEFVTETVDYLTRLRHRPANLKLLVWRETSAQHFTNMVGGYWEPGFKNDRGSCTPFANESTNTTYMNLLLKAASTSDATTTPMRISDRSFTGLHLFNMRKICQLANLTLLNALEQDFLNIPLPGRQDNKNSKNNNNAMEEVIYLPTRFFQANLHYLHTKYPSKFGADCTHWCNTGILWDPTWRGLSRAMHRIFQQYNKLPSPEKSIQRAPGYPELAALRREQEAFPKAQVVFEVPRKTEHANQ